MDLTQIFNKTYPVIGVVHLLPLPTSARWGGSLTSVLERAEQEATALVAGGVDGIIIENFFDAPFTKDQVDPAIISAMTLIVDRIKNLVVVPVGINLLRNDAIGAMAIASTINAQFIRVNVLTGIIATDQGLIEGNAHKLLRYRRELGADVAILADILVENACYLGIQNLTTAVEDTLERGLADGIILSGWATGRPPSLEDLKLASAAAQGTPVFIGSGANWDNIGQLMQVADGVIVASSLKRNGRIKESIDPIRVAQFVEAAQQVNVSKERSQSKPSLKLTL
ncbi:MAG: BtpA/SgcQ family protein [cyanobacterium endosymbiont of Epithemia adnata isolate EadnSB Bon19]|uniref:photosystem I biogenesis protein BtpA n=1 Tax=cyanobacterium endosymbiont of Epithemia turgida TaxID=718217 RepID=UPI0004D19D4A|nr:BtpA/SgcQ family protein [cyanobacterium endosymbiont of Epithemia turgida]BAP18526.1 photosystem I biogenesis protein [cyanobacterium endosymbiont of Epithemia turgida isolate EtSB Lake Yunoko]